MDVSLHQVGWVINHAVLDCVLTSFPLGELCVDERPAVRKSASQTLFSTIAAHGDLLQQPTWQAVVWQVRLNEEIPCFICLACVQPSHQVLFPLLDSVKKLSSQASDEKVDTSGSLLIHHSRNTAQKQWAETQVNRPVFQTTSGF